MELVKGFKTNEDAIMEYNSIKERLGPGWEYDIYEENGQWYIEVSYKDIIQVKISSENPKYEIKIFSLDDRCEKLHRGDHLIESIVTCISTYIENFLYWSYNHKNIINELIILEDNLDIDELRGSIWEVTIDRASECFHIEAKSKEEAEQIAWERFIRNRLCDNDNYDAFVSTEETERIS